MFLLTVTFEQSLTKKNKDEKSKFNKTRSLD